MPDFVFEIQAELKEMVGTPDVRHWSDTSWTLKLMERLHKLGTDHRYECYPSKSDSPPKQAWLYDLVWWEAHQGRPREGFAKSMPLAVESEWEMKPTRDGDFEKL